MMKRVGSWKNGNAFTAMPLIGQPLAAGADMARGVHFRGAIVARTVWYVMKMADLVQWGAERNNRFFLRAKSNGEWEAGWGDAAGESSVRADTAIAALRVLHNKYAVAE